jgi:hypothetical protein
MEAVLARPDGHTMLMGNIGPQSIAYSLFRNLPYGPGDTQGWPAPAVGAPPREQNVSAVTAAHAHRTWPGVRAPSAGARICHGTCSSR